MVRRPSRAVLGYLEIDLQRRCLKMALHRRFLSWLALVLVCAQGRAQAPAAVPYSTPVTCNSTEFFRTGDLSCVECGDNQIPTEVWEDGLQCACAPGYIRPQGTSGNDFECQACSDGEAASRDGLFCLACASPPGYDPSSRTCGSCAPTEVYDDGLPLFASLVGNRSCAQCPEGTWADPSGYSCVECGVDDCQDCSPDNIFGGVCFPAGHQPSQPPPNVFAYYSQHYSAAVELCQQGNQTSCQLLANLCVLQTYSRSDPACLQSLALAGELLPSIYYPEHGADEVLESTSIRTKFAVSDNSDYPSALPLVVVTFDLSGALVDVEDISDQILLCPDRYSHVDEGAWQVGVAYQIECSVPVDVLSTSAESPLFYDLYLRDRSSGSDRLHPVPVLVENYRDTSGDDVNEDSDRGDWQFVRRFYLAESTTDRPQYARSMKLRVELDSDGRVFPPYLVVSYSSWSPSLSTGDTLGASFAVEYRQDTTGFDIAIAVIVFVLVVVAAVYIGFKVNGFLRRSGNLCCTLHTFIYLTVDLCAGISTAIFVLLAFAATFWLIFFKAETTYLLALPVEAQEIGFYVLLPLALLCRIIYTFYLIWHQCTVDLFLIDWERPRGVVPTANHVTDAAALAPPTGSAGSSPVSIWRTYFIANEWNEIQSLRKINSTMLLLLVVLFLEVVGFKHLAERDPSSHVTTSEDRYSAPHSRLLRFSLTSLHFIIIAAVMRLFVFLVYERFVEHKIRQFVDLCSVSNVSVFMISRKLYGFYIHGRSVHGHADTNMREMNHNLHKEQEDMCGKRGLVPDSDDQTFEMALNVQFRVQYDRIIAPIQAERAEGQPHANLAERGQTGTGGGQGLSEASLRAYEDMNQFLSAFIERSLRDLDYVVKEKLFLEKALGMEFYDPVDRSLLYRDPGYSFDGVLFYGNEWSLLLLEILIFAVVDLAAQSYVLAAVITYILSWFVCYARDALGRRNLGRKTLVDSRFLI